MEVMKKYLRKKKTPKKLQSRIRKYLNYVWDAERSVIHEKELYASLSSSLKSDVVTLVNGSILKNIPILFKNLSRLFLKKVVFIISEQICGPEERILTV